MAEVVIVDGETPVGELAADIIAGVVDDSPDAVIGLATGSTPLPVYRALARRVASGEADLSRTRAFALDEYIGLAEGHPQSYRAVIDREAVVPLGLDAARVRVPPGSLQDIETAGERYEREIVDAGGIDVQLLGIGTDGHIGFNEPGSSFASLTRVKTLTAQTRRDNARFFSRPEDVPVHCITQGLGTILRARHLLLLAFGRSKADALRAAVEGPVTASVPASAIQLHPHVTVLVDAAAAAGLGLASYYRHAYAHKPAWQGF